MIEKMRLDDGSYESNLEQSLQLLGQKAPWWTHTGASDPGVTLLELWSLLTDIQSGYMDQVKERHYRQYLKLAGIAPDQGEKARAWVCVENVKKSMVLPKGTKMLAGEVVFETEREELLTDNEIIAFGLGSSEGVPEDNNTMFMGESRQYSFPLMREEDGSLFTIYLRRNLKTGESLKVLVLLQEGVGRNRPDRDTFCLARLCWEYQANEGWERMETVFDGTYGLLFSGHMIIKRSGTDTHGKRNVTAGYKVRCRIEEGGFDRMPVLQDVLLNAVRVCQQDTLCSTFYFTYESGLEEGRNGRIVENQENSREHSGCISCSGDSAVEDSLFRDDEDPAVEDSLLRDYGDSAVEDSLFRDYGDSAVEDSLLRDDEDPAVEDSLLRDYGDSAVEDSLFRDYADSAVEDSLLRDDEDSAVEDSLFRDDEDSAVEDSLLRDYGDSAVEDSLFSDYAALTGEMEVFIRTKEGDWELCGSDRPGEPECNGGEVPSYYGIRRKKLQFIGSSPVKAWPQNKTVVKVVCRHPDFALMAPSLEITGAAGQEIVLPWNNVCRESVRLQLKKCAGSLIFREYECTGQESTVPYAWHWAEEPEAILLGDGRHGCIPEASWEEGILEDETLAEKAYMRDGMCITSLVLWDGKKGNVSAGRICAWEKPEMFKGLKISNPVPATGGRDRLTAREQFAGLEGKLSVPHSAVTAQDYARLAEKTPGLILPQASVRTDGLELKVLIQLPQADTDSCIKETYIREVSRYLEEHRLINTNVVVGVEE